MSRKRLGRLQRAATIVPLALLSAAWTASVAGTGGPVAPMLASDLGEGTLADGTGVPDDTIDDPASLSNPGSVEGVEKRNEAGIVAAAATNQIPSAALAAYQRAESVINSADKSCKLTWQVLAAIGRIESNHGRSDGNVLSDDGVAEPGIYGAALNGRKKTTAIPDTDGGQFDNDQRWDRAVGPMQFIPSTWSVVGVDADGDGQRNPQDIDDAALASAVYLCSGKDNLSTASGKRTAIYRYNNSDDYVSLVLKVADAYVDGDYATVPNNSTAAGYIVPEPTYAPTPKAPAPTKKPAGTTGKSPGVGSPSPAAPTGGSGTTRSDGGSGSTTGSGGSGGVTDSGGSSGSGSKDSGGTKGSDGPIDVPSTGTPLDDVVEPVVTAMNGMLGKLLPEIGKTRCRVVFALWPSKREECLASYGG
ncbi:lytic murein transglycosylase [Nocardioides sp. YIM 152588]|uniref:lytic transglycosylase domain-containing protein n=1 Tax=Nocardioides sp. YIM 152588 TaxID=3158259 RepID=UPI0032E4C1E2